MFKTRLDTFGKDFGLFLNFESFLIFWKHFEDSTLHGTLGKKNLKKLPQNMFKTRLDTFGNDFGLFCNFEIFFSKTFRRLDPPWNTGLKIFFRKNYPKTSLKHVWTLLGTTLGFFWILKVFWFFENISKTRPSMQHWARNFSEKLPQNLFKTCLDTFGNDFEHSWKFEFFLIFWKHFEDSTLHRTLGK